MNKKHLILGLLAVGCLRTAAQSSSGSTNIAGLSQAELSSIIKQSISLPGTESFMEAKVGSKQQVQIAPYPIALPASLNLSSTRHEVKMSSEMEARKSASYVRIRSIDRDQNSVIVNMTCFYKDAAGNKKYATILCGYHKVGADWKMVKHTINQI